MYFIPPYSSHHLSVGSNGFPNVYEALPDWLLHTARNFFMLPPIINPKRWLDLTKWEDLQNAMAYQRAFLESYFDESRCCSGMFVNMDCDHDHDGTDDSLSCHAIMSPSCVGTSAGSMEEEIAAQDLVGNTLWVAVLHYSDTYTTATTSILRRASTAETWYRCFLGTRQVQETTRHSSAITTISEGSASGEARQAWSEASICEMQTATRS